MKTIGFLFFLSLVFCSCKEENTTKSSCGEAAHYNIIAELEWENQWFNFNTRLFDEKLRRKGRDLFDISTVKIYEKEFKPFQEVVEKKLDRQFDDLSYIILYYDANISTEDTKIKLDDIKGISIYDYQRSKKRYAHSLYKRGAHTFEIVPKYSSLLSELIYNHLNDIMQEELFPNQLNTGYMLVQNITEVRRHYKERKAHNRSFFDFGSASYRERPHSDEHFCNFSQWCTIKKQDKPKRSACPVL